MKDANHGTTCLFSGLYVGNQSLCPPSSSLLVGVASIVSCRSERRRRAGHCAGCRVVVLSTTNRAGHHSSSGSLCTKSQSVVREGIGVGIDRIALTDLFLCPVGREIASGKSGVRTFLAEAGEIGIDQTRIPLARHDIRASISFARSGGNVATIRSGTLFRATPTT
jgi:hypothetical protein